MEHNPFFLTQVLLCGSSNLHAVFHGMVQKVYGSHNVANVTMNPTKSPIGLSPDSPIKEMSDTSAYLYSKSLALPSRIKAISRDQRSQSIPISHAMRRTPSQLRFRDEQEAAAFRDKAMFMRLVDGVSKQRFTKLWTQAEKEKCLSDLVGTRNGTTDESYEEDYVSSTTKTHSLSFQDEQDALDDEGIFEMDL